MNRKLGAMPPPNQYWQTGKTAATIAFINEAEEYLKNNPKTSPNVALEQFVNRLKDGKETLKDWLTVKEFLNSNFIKNLG